MDLGPLRLVDIVVGIIVIVAGFVGDLGRAGLDAKKSALGAVERADCRP